jgi:cyclopropane-fatty-acyl-phospholipid synthase
MKRRSTPTPRERAARALVLGLLGRMTEGAVIVYDGTRRYLCGRPQAGEQVPEARVHSPETWPTVAREGTLGLGRAFAQGWWSCGDLDELTLFLRVVLRNSDALERTRAAATRMSTPLRRVRAEHDEPERAQIQQLLRDGTLTKVLDESWTASTALFASPSTPLKDAQVAKHDRICRALGLGPADHVLEVGTGLGSFAIHAAATYGCRISATADAPAQAEIALGRVKQAGLEDLVTILPDAPEDLRGTYDKVVSIEALRQRSWREHEAFLQRLARLCAPSGLVGLQCVVVADQHYERAKRSDDFVSRYVFPGSSLPSVTSLLHAATSASDLRLVYLDDIGAHRAETLRRWRSRLEEASDDLERLGVSALARRLVAFHLCDEEASCAERRTSAVWCVLAKSRWRPGVLGWPLV